MLNGSSASRVFENVRENTIHLQSMLETLSISGVWHLSLACVDTQNSVAVFATRSACCKPPQCRTGTSAMILRPKSSIDTCLIIPTQLWRMNLAVRLRGAQPSHHTLGCCAQGRGPGSICPLGCLPRWPHGLLQITSARF